MFTVSLVFVLSPRIFEHEFAIFSVPPSVLQGTPPTIGPLAAPVSVLCPYIRTARPVVSSERAPDRGKTVSVWQIPESGHEPKKGLGTKTDRLTDRSLVVT
jgi:hypothetical protein